MAKYTFLKRLKTKDYENNIFVPYNSFVGWNRMIKSATCWGMPGLTWEKITPTRNDQKESFLHFIKEDK